MKVIALKNRKIFDVLTLSSHPDSVAQVEQYVEKIFQQYRLSTRLYGNILISLTEAVNNAICHGNNRDVSKKVKVTIKKYKHKLGFIVSDEGNGFDFERLPDPTAPQNLMKSGGRGVFIIRQLADQVFFHDNGSTVEIQFNI